MKNRTGILCLMLLVVTVLFVACNSDGQCRQDRYVALKIDFKKIVVDSLGDRTVSTLSVDSVTAYGFDIDSILYDNKKSVNTVDFPLNRFADFSQYIISFNDTIDTLTILHANVEEYISFACGILTTHTIDSVSATTNFIDSVAINKNDVNTTYATNIELFHRYNYVAAD